MFDLTGRTALVTGGGSGIGKASCLALAAHGADVAIADLGNFAAAVELAREIEAMGRRAFALQVDVGDEEQVHGMVEAAIARLGHLDILFANAGISDDTSPLWEISSERWERMLRVNFTGVFYCLRAVVPHMIERRYGRIITTSSQLAHKPSPWNAHYCASKSGVLGLTLSLAQEVAQYGITVNTVAPGPTATPMWNRGGNSEWQRWKLGSMPVGMQRPGRPEEIAAAVVFLASDEASYMIGQTVSPNGGDVMWA